MKKANKLFFLIDLKNPAQIKTTDQKGIVKHTQKTYGINWGLPNKSTQISSLKPNKAMEINDEKIIALNKTFKNSPESKLFSSNEKKGIKFISIPNRPKILKHINNVKLNETKPLTSAPYS